MRTVKKQKGFSLLELLAVVVILGIIAAVVVPRVTTSSQTAKDKVNAFNKATMNAAIERYYIDNSGWPANLAALVPTYLPDGVPAHPNGLTYGIDGTTHRVNES